MSGRKGGRPSKAEVQERERCKKAFAREQEQHRQMKSRIKQGLVEVISWDEAVDRHMTGNLRDDLVVTQPSLLSPAAEFLLGRLNGVRDEQWDMVLHQAILDLLEKTNVPIDEDGRRDIATLFRMLKRTPEQKKRDEDRAKVRVAGWWLAEAERRGEATADARNQVAEALGFPSGEALRKFLKKNKRLLDGGD
jgi:hypothetical protein